jgi:hypothetical protein
MNEGVKVTESGSTKAPAWKLPLSLSMIEILSQNDDLFIFTYILGEA